jgi:hypothetical protein
MVFGLPAPTLFPPLGNTTPYLRPLDYVNLSSNPARLVETGGAYQDFLPFKTNPREPLAWHRRRPTSTAIAAPKFHPGKRLTH